tara:strand:- start:2198 stop:3052 length:855 start_codon:yes stop_codon:yes gene_type:complete
MKIELYKKNYQSSALTFGVIGHVEWVDFCLVDQIPKAGEISHAISTFEEVAGGGSVSAIKMSKLSNNKIKFFTSLGRDACGEKCLSRLNSYGIDTKVAWRKSPTRKGISFVDKKGERAITVIGKRLEANIRDDLPWDELKECDAIFITAADSQLIRLCREASVVCATPRLGIRTINESQICLDAIIGSGLDPGERFEKSELQISPKYIIKTEGKSGGEYSPGGRFKAIISQGTDIDSYGCGDSFAAGVTVGLGSKLSIEDSIYLGAELGSECSKFLGPYDRSLT